MDETNHKRAKADMAIHDTLPTRLRELARESPAPIPAEVIAANLQTAGEVRTVDWLTDGLWANFGMVRGCQRRPRQRV